MKINSKVIKILSLAIVVAMIIPSFSFASGKVSKEETVYVNLDEKGAPIEKTSSIWLHSDTSLGKVKDKSTLKEIKNVKGEEEPKIDGDKIVWETDEKDIFYQGKSNKDLPIDVEVKYYLNEKEVEPKDIAGKSGKIKIKLEVKNKDSHVVSMKNGKQKTLYTPFVTVAVMNMPLDKFKNVNINSGKLVSDGNNQVITYVALPGVKESLDLDKDTIDIPNFLEVEADVTDFEMSPIVITTTSEIPEIDDISGTEDLDELIDGIEKIKEASEKLSEATGKLYEGQISLSGGIDELVNGVGKVNTGANDLRDGTKQLKDGVDASYKGSQEISKGAGDLAQGVSQLGEGVMKFGNGAVKFSENAKGFSNGASQVAKGVSQIPEKAKEMNDGMKYIADNTTKIQVGQEELTERLGDFTNVLGEIREGKELALKNAQTPEEVQELKKDIAIIDQIESEVKKAQSSSMKLNMGLKKVNKGQKEISAGIDELVKGEEISELQKASKKLTQGSEGLLVGANKLDENAKKIGGSTKQLSNGSKELSTGADKLTNGLGQLDNGAGQLYTGADALSKGTGELSNGGMKLKDGSNQLKDGAKELDEGMNKFHKEGISEISKRIDESDLDIDTIMDTKDELINLSKEYNSFTGASEEMESSVKFVMKTEQIKGEEEKEELDIENKEEEKGGFINWLKNLFKKEK
ncbi:hypothetical protein KQH90_05440 [Anaerosalibacter bizertensis]|uniref:hypothetical protein n=1 Tax=Anaerosalibacter bizertensis TaxID=932217 RepID=UPI001C0EF4F7|nr:hypothetical protein [Anaerosalibacter bizertensis]MBU5293471.1 hypothetical protein [Anaerosalibacter bizertensis]